MSPRQGSVSHAVAEAQQAASSIVCRRSADVDRWRRLQERPRSDGRLGGSKAVRNRWLFCMLFTHSVGDLLRHHCIERLF
jgi:hypothetical protein